MHEYRTTYVCLCVCVRACLRACVRVRFDILLLNVAGSRDVSQDSFFGVIVRGADACL